MNTERSSIQPISALLTTLLLVVVGLAFLGYAMGWVTVDSEPDKTTIELDTKEMKESADQAVDSARETADRVGRAANNAAREFQDEVKKPDSPEPESEDPANEDAPGSAPPR